MTQTLDPTVSALQESVRHNEKNIDRLDRSLNDFRAEVLQRFDKLETSIDDRFNKIDDRFNKMESKMDDRFEKIDDRFEKLESKMDDRFKQTNMALLTLAGFIISGVGIIVAAIKGVF